MKALLILICIFALSSASSTAATAPPDGSVSKAALEGPTPAAQRAHGKQTAPRSQSNLAGLRGTVVKEMRATKAFVKENVVKEEGADRGLMLLAAIGMIVLQLRRKHKSLPQRQIAPYA
jgi:hypothetical protein